ncbi:methyl-accepting chemotaxis protein [Paenibacillus flagellatus]|uniref:methyl-accepting chemotaxis protein n=1 Tax=Paenibacillus flagellatus TaxID=2211139 RepID=UPI00130545FC|nr:methyl-accepting chemotaxis protein [Paenibacillus flagellatus]
MNPDSANPTRKKRTVLLTVKNRLIASFLLLLLVPGTLIGTISYRTAAGSIADRLIGSAAENVELVDQTIRQYIQLEMQDVDMLAGQLSSAMIDRKDHQARQLVDGFTSKHPELELLTLGNENGAWMKSPDPGAQEYDPRTRDWYKQTMQSPGQVVVTDPYVSVTSGNVVVTVAKTLQDGKGVVGVNLSLQKLAEIVKNVKIGTEGYVYVLDRTGKFLVHPTNEAGKAAEGAHYEEILKGDAGVVEYVLNGNAKRAAYATNPTTGWKIVGTMEVREVGIATAPILHNTVIVIVSALSVGAVLIFFIIRSITSPLRQLTEASARVSGGDLTETIPIRSGDEFGRLAESFNRMTESLRHVLLELSETSSQLAASSEEMTAGTGQTSQAAERIAGSIQNAARSMDTQTQRAQETARVMEEMSIGVQRIAESAHVIVETSSKTEEDVHNGGETVQQVKRQMTALRDSIDGLAGTIRELTNLSASIREMNEAIADIAGQTNLLSLNAAIEAARAGEQGKGFAVVAHEVRKLADRSSRTADDIHTVIAEMNALMERASAEMDKRVREAADGIAVVLQAESAFRQIEKSTLDVVGQIQDISSITEQMSASSEQVAASAQEMADSFREASGSYVQVAASSQEQLASMEEINGAAEALARMAEQLQRVVERFKL